MGVFPGFGSWINQNSQQPLKAESKRSENGKSKSQLQENIVILTDILTENEILGIFRRISSEYTDEIPRKAYSSENTDEYPRIYYSRWGF
ncbi:hypothetical protein DY000_02059040 [Brassica cretica]|uniref:Uncharacterized protein n=1 Tax=Brassica cretica TaxID=69181 RepID=A0ABQ7AQR5_BRACR|nr:hypothetical protein DY000_02059040 [Brassica cretica]